MPDACAPGCEYCALCRERDDALTRVEAAERERDQAHADISMHEDDLLSLHDLLADAGWAGAINAESVAESVKSLLAQLEEARAQRDALAAAIDAHADATVFVYDPDRALWAERDRITGGTESTP